jgi:hypothetical protein
VARLSITPATASRQKAIEPNGRQAQQMIRAGAGPPNTRLWTTSKNFMAS